MMEHPKRVFHLILGELVNGNSNITWREPAERHRMQDPLEMYVENLLKTKGEPNTPESRSLLLNKVNEAIDKALIEALPLKQLDKLENATEQNQVSENIVEELLAEANANPSKIINDTLTNFQNEYIKGEK